jgi:hypothetical protein
MGIDKENAVVSHEFRITHAEMDAFRTLCGDTPTGRRHDAVRH